MIARLALELATGDTRRLTETDNAPYCNQILIGDVLETLRAMPSTPLFDVVIADPPYNIGVDFGEYKDAMPIEEYIRWTSEWVAECRKRLKSNGIMYIYGFPEILAHIAVQYPIPEQRWLQWHYTNKTVPRLRFWQRAHESILCLWKPGERQPVLEVDQIREPYTENYRRAAGTVRAGTPSRFGRGNATIYNAHPNGALPRDVIKVPALAGGAGAAERWFMCVTHDHTVYPPSELKHHHNCEVVKHPTQKPSELTRRLLRSRINYKGGRVLVPFAGSGSECVAALKEGIEYLGIEINSMYANMARQWVDQVEREGILKFTPRMRQTFQRSLEKFHMLFQRDRVAGWQLEELIFRAIKSDTQANHYVQWIRGGRGDKSDIVVTESGRTHLIQIKSGQIQNTRPALSKSGTKRTPHLVLSSHRMGRFDGDLAAITQYLNDKRDDMLSVSGRTEDDEQGRRFHYKIYYVAAARTQGLDPDGWQRNGSQFVQVNRFGVEVSLRPSMSWQVWFKVPLVGLASEADMVIG